MSRAPLLTIEGPAPGQRCEVAGAGPLLAEAEAIIAEGMDERPPAVKPRRWPALGAERGDARGGRGRGGPQGDLFR